MGDRDDPLDIFAPPAAQAGGGRLVWGLVAGIVACAALAFAVAAWQLLPAPGGAGARPSAALPPRPVDAAPPKIVGAPTGAIADPAPVGPAAEQPGGRWTGALPAPPPAAALRGVAQDVPAVWPGEPAAPEAPAAGTAPPAAALPAAAPTAVDGKPAKPRRPPAAPASAASARCRAAVAAAQIGEGVSPADLARMRAGCAD